MRRLVKKILKKTVVTMRAYIRRLEEEGKERPSEKEHDYDQDDYAYPWLNSLLVKILDDRCCAERPNYAFGVLQSVHLAKAIGIRRVSVIEFGVAGGNGLISLERIAERVEDIFGVGIEVFGFDAGMGLPKPQDYRDLPDLYREGAFPMDSEKLRKRLKKAQLVLGLVEKTVPALIRSTPPPSPSSPLISITIVRLFKPLGS